ncbi:MAG: recombinase family protein [Mogibacterium sp.]|nr:recombinase family protein [Mogibacterium sp.]
MSNYGYVRVSSTDQNEERQLIALNELGIEIRKYVDKQSGKDFNRPEYKKMIKQLREGDVLYIKSIDRLGRNYEEIQNHWRIITKEKKADVVVLDMPLLDTRQHKNFMGTFISDIVLQILSFAAENEMRNIKIRQAEGIAAAKAKGVKFGKRPMELPSNFDKVCNEVIEGEISIRQGAKQLGMATTTFYEKYKKRRSIL